ncbi:MAG TPA: histidine phosphatase family protein [Aggregatilinea sp.]|jgi:broad specificity phosphatase PhoE|uniref:histidine phosphatase family protein n=1 Tax=Aggregatilinea sp. TaxID=2806333 RepID=UPI002C0EB32D|nr:histidine phosphatase family protein [Aggregatilinea sp.]HML23822.1 histidine phosphatase family protein [Aggregatilinea sp.]
MRLILVRNGQSQNGDQGEDHGLSELGKQQSELLGQWMRAYEPGITALVSSPARCTRETTSILSRYIDAPVSVDDDLRDSDRHLLMELPRLVHPSDVGPHYYILPHDNYYQRFAEQTRRVVNRLIENPSSIRTVVVVCETGFAATTVRMLLRCHHMHIWMHHTAMHYLTWQEGLWDLRGVNYIPHLSHDMLTI